ncbi:D-aminoacylase [Mycobacterium sp. AMU20-3851]|uniref:N-acyl-D-amino-acid deacylase family protein n=1 Tax=Mycobacterium sp. AMU20-3851 TaxID=3122055 RepID=UPI0037543819
MTRPFDGVLTGGVVIDGTGGPAVAADIRLDGGRITQVAPSGSLGGGGESIDVSGRAVLPGFVDIHTHADFSLPTHPSASSMVRQGVTTLVVGNCGFSPFPVGPGEHADQLRQATAIFGRDLNWQWNDLPGYAEHLAEIGIAVNVAPLVGHGALRIAVMGYERRDATHRELADMCSLTEESMAAGAFGMSSGLIYPPGTFAGRDELVALCRVVAAHGGIYSTHMRNEGEQLLVALDEALDIAQRSGARLQLSHHKVLGRRNWGLTAISLQRIDEAIAAGADIALDQYPYPASSTTMLALVPGWAAEGGAGALAARLRDPVTRAEIRTEVLDGPTDGRPKRDFEPDTVMISSVGLEEHAPFVGRRLDEIAAAVGGEPVDVMLDLLGRDGAVEVVIFAIGDEDIERVMAHPRVAVASDGWTMHPDEGGTPHPRSYGTFARVLQRYVREQHLLSLPEAVRRMTSLPADRLGLPDRGRIAPGMVADLVVLDPQRVREQATFVDPHQFATGIDDVFVAGVPVVRAGTETEARPGKVLRHTRTERERLTPWT